jgi:hypothetical protein
MRHTDHTHTDGMAVPPGAAELIGLDAHRLAARWPGASHDGQDERCYWHIIDGTDGVVQPFSCSHAPTRLGARIGEQATVSEVVYEWTGVSWDTLTDILQAFTNSYREASWDSASHTYRFTRGELVVRFASSLDAEALSYVVRVAYSSV